MSRLDGVNRANGTVDLWPHSRGTMREKIIIYVKEEGANDLSATVEGTRWSSMFSRFVVKEKSMSIVTLPDQLSTQNQQHWRDWWDHKGLVLWLSVGRQTAAFDAPAPPPTDDLEQRWMNPHRHIQRQLRRIAFTEYYGQAFPYISLTIGPGDLALYLGSEPGFSEETVWYQPCIDEPDGHSPLRFDLENGWLKRELDMARLGVAVGRFPVGLPDLLENLDILTAMRGPQNTMMDLIERPEWCLEKIDQINAAFIEAFECFNQIIQLPCGGNVFSAFAIWGPGRTAKVQCDALAMISPSMSAKFVMPALTRQCAWLDYSMFHLDGEQALGHLDNLLAIEPLRAIEWTPVGCYRGEGGGHRKWYDLYRRILAAGKSVQAIAVRHDQVIPLLDAVGPAGMYISTSAPNRKMAEQLVERVNTYR